MVTITPYDTLALGMGCSGSLTSATYPSANRAVFYPFRALTSFTVYGFWMLNGATASGNIDLGIYSLDGTRLTSTGTNAQSGTSTKQEITLGSSVLLGAGMYYMALAMDNATGTVLRRSTSAIMNKMHGLKQSATSFVLPATVTFATYSSASLPIYGARIY